MRQSEPLTISGWRMEDLQLVVSQIQAAMDADRVINIRITDGTSVAFIALLFQQLTPLMHAVEKLLVAVPLNGVAALYEFLAFTPAPRLRYLSIEVPTGCAEQLPPTLFTPAPLLSPDASLDRVRLVNVVLPGIAVSAFRDTQVVSYNYNGPLPVVVNIFRSFRSMAELYVDLEDNSEPEYFGYQEPEAEPTLRFGETLPSLATLRVLDATLPTSSQLFELFPNYVSFSSIEDVHWQLSDQGRRAVPFHKAYERCTALPHKFPLYVCLQGHRVLFRHGTQTRRVDLMSGAMLTPAIMTLTVGPRVADTIAILGVSTMQWLDASQYLVYMPLLQVLCIRYGEDEHEGLGNFDFPLQHPDDPVPCRRLRMLVVEDEVERGRLPIAKLASFIEDGLSINTHKISVLVKGVSLTGEITSLRYPISRIFACASDDTSGWLRGLVDDKGDMRSPETFVVDPMLQLQVPMACIAVTNESGVLSQIQPDWELWMNQQPGQAEDSDVTDDLMEL